MSTSGPNYPSTVTATGSAVAWSNPTNSLSPPNSIYATSSLSAFDSTNQLRWSGFGFAIPSGATINGIALEVGVLSSSGSLEDNTVRLDKAGSPVGSNKASPTNLPTSLTNWTYGGVSDLWGTTWTDSEINHSGFGAEWSAIADSFLANGTVSIDYARITVYYTAGGITVSVTGVDAASVTESRSITAAIRGGDNSTLGETVSIVASLRDSDASRTLDGSASTNTGSSLILPFGSSDAVAVAEAFSLSVFVLDSESLSVADESALLAGLLDLDSCGLGDMGEVGTPRYFIVAMDSAVGADFGVPLAQVTGIDSASVLVSTQRYTAIVVGTDSVSSPQLGFSFRYVYSTDSARGYDSQTVSSYTSTLVYNVYANDGAGGPINYGSIVATTDGLTWTSAPLAYAGQYKFGVRAQSILSGLEEENLDASVRLLLDSTGHDITNLPLPPTSIQVRKLKAGHLQVEWTYPLSVDARKPTGFRIYQGFGSPSYTTPVATTPYGSGMMFRSEISGLTDGVAYTFGVRAYNSVAEETNTLVATETADATGPDAVLELTFSSVPSDDR